MFYMIQANIFTHLSIQSLLTSKACLFVDKVGKSPHLFGNFSTLLYFEHPPQPLPVAVMCSIGPEAFFIQEWWYTSTERIAPRKYSHWLLKFKGIENIKYRFWGQGGILLPLSMGEIKNLRTRDGGESLSGHRDVLLQGDDRSYRAGAVPSCPRTVLGRMEG